MDKWFGGMQRIGGAVMLPIAVLPAAALLLRLGAPDIFNIPFIMKAGETIFTNIALIFAIGVAIGIARDNNGAAALAGAIGYLVLTAGMKAIDENLDMGVLAGIVSGIEAGFLYNRFHCIKVPECVGFFGGTRLVPIITALLAAVSAAVFSIVWEPCQNVINSLGVWIVNAGAVGAFIYGLLNRLLIPIGLHHILNSFIWFISGNYTTADGVAVTGDLSRFFAGDPNAGMFMAGFYIMMMFGMPAAALAIYHAAKPENRTKIKVMLLIMAFTSFFTGITEPIEFMFMFLAPGLYVVHAILTGLALAAAYSAGILHGFSFSAGFIDYILNWGIATNPVLIIPIGLIFGVVYYIIFSWAIRYFDIHTVGRYSEEAVENAETGVLYVPELITKLGGADNLEEVRACITRLRINVRNAALVDEKSLKALGVKGVVRKGQNIQVIVGTRAESIAKEINTILKR
ncbi:PTS transporter subunit EIIC [Pectinatus haikarae]|uniref:PTS transporter subunit EIIC n=1 Tax=Pectinatus haikarae TaxID=349096 RepID=UPI0018C55C65|nr:PTS transporter subunit EIIC [Pectinatus haikarae]